MSPLRPRGSIKVGIIGCGRATITSPLPALSALSDLDMVAIADIDPSRLQKRADRFHVQRRCTNYSATLEDPNGETIPICVPAQFHVEVASAAFESGKHVFFEKPLALSLEETDRLITCAAWFPGKIMLGFNLLAWFGGTSPYRDLSRKLGSIEIGLFRVDQLP